MVRSPASRPTCRGHDRGKGVPSFDEMMDFALVEVDFDDPTMNVRGRRALAITKPTLRVSIKWYQISRLLGEILQFFVG